MSNENDADIGEVSKFLIGTLQRCQMFIAEICVQIARFNAGEFRQIIDHLLLCRYVIVYERDAFFGSLATHHKKKTSFKINSRRFLSFLTPNTHPRMHVMRATLM